MSGTKERVTRGHGNEEGGETMRGITFPKGPPEGRGSPKRCFGFTELKEQKHRMDRAESQFLLYIQKL